MCCMVVNESESLLWNYKTMPKNDMNTYDIHNIKKNPIYVWQHALQESLIISIGVDPWSL